MAKASSTSMPRYWAKGEDIIEICLAFLLGVSVGYAIRAAILNNPRANVRLQLYVREHSALDG
jgi:uncharacterized membrane protein YbjE (DUF340 family)